jgi:mono/diheme cytochrome c family protein
LTSKQSARRALAGVLLLGSSALSGCTDYAGYDLDRIIGSVPWLSVLREDVSYDPYELPRLPAEGSIPVASPVGDVPPPFTQLQLDSVAGTLTSPLQPTAAVLERGKIQYERNCAVCHGAQGAGNGTVVGNGKFPFAPPVNGANTAGRTDGYLYAIIRVGRGLMPAYGDRMTHQDRWAVVAYMRQLQGRSMAAPAAAPAVGGAGTR